MKKILLAVIVLVMIPVALLLVVNFNKSSVNDDRQETQSTGVQESFNNSSPADMSRYVDFVSLDTDANTQEHRVLFFKADWCITCNSLDKDIEENASSIPEDVQIIRVDFDHETSLKQKYDVRQQHTLVQIDSEGNVVKKWFLSPSLEHILERIERT